MTDRPALDEVARTLAIEAAHLEEWEGINERRGAEPDQVKARTARCFRVAERIVRDIHLDEAAFRSVFEQLAERRRKARKRAA